MNIPRLALIQSLIEKNNYNRYLEIGVSIGTVFFRVRCKNKIAVDPEFGFNKFKILTRSIRLNNFSNFSAKYFEKKSDDFFQSDADEVLKKGLDIALVDGMHEYAYVLNDIQNTLTWLSGDGVIIVHDCNPRTAENGSSYLDWEKRGFTGEWNGDVWKSIVHLRSLRQDLDVFVADIDQGLGIITKKPKAESALLPFKSFDEINALPFSEFNSYRKQWLNLKPASYLNEYFGTSNKFT